MKHSLSRKFSPNKKNKSRSKSRKSSKSAKKNMKVLTQFKKPPIKKTKKSTR